MSFASASIRLSASVSCPLAAILSATASRIESTPSSRIKSLKSHLLMTQILRQYDDATPRQRLCESLRPSSAVSVVIGKNQDGFDVLRHGGGQRRQLLRASTGP